MSRDLFCAASFALAPLLCIPFAAAQTAAPHHVSNHDRDRAQREFVAGGQAVENKNLPAAVAAFTRAAELNPGDADFTAALAIARDNWATELMQQALKDRLLGDTAGFRTHMHEAEAQDSRNPLVLEHAADLADVEAPQPEARPAPYSDLAVPVSLAPTGGTHSFHLRLPQGELLRQVLGAWDIVPSVDSSVGNAVVPFDADDVDFDDVLHMLTLTTDTFFVPLDPHRVLFALDNRENRSRFQRMSLETVYLAGLAPTEVSDVSNIARNLFGATQVSTHEANTTLTLRVPERQMDAFNSQLQELLSGRGEVTLQVDMYEVQRVYNANEGAEIPQTTTVFNINSQVQSLISNNASLVQEIISSGLASAGNVEEIAAALVLSGQAGSTILSQPFAYFGGGLTATGVSLTSATANLQLNDVDTRMLDRLELRLEDQQEGVLKVGERYPIVTASYSNLATSMTGLPGISTAGLSTNLQNLGSTLAALSSAATASVPQFQYQDIGLNLTATPRIEVGGTISLKIHFDLSSLAGQALNGNPVINNRSSDSILSVQPGEQTVLVSQLSNQESATLIGLPFLSEIPGFTLGTNKTIANTRDSLVIVITPHVVRLGHTQPKSQMVLLPAHS